MAYLIIEPLPKVKLGTTVSLSPAEVNWHGRHYAAVSVPDDTPLFYDWVRNDNGNIVGIDLYFWQEHAESLHDLCDALVKHEEGAARILFLPQATGVPDGTQGFGNIFFYRCSRSRWLIAIEIESWVRPSDTQWLMKIGHAKV